MILLGDNLVPYENLEKISIIEDIKNTSSNSTIFFTFNEDILKYCFEQNIAYAVIVSSIKEAVYANALNAKYIISKQDLSSKIQKIADNYMFDSKNIAIINSNEEFENIANDEIDGIIYEKVLV